MSDRRLALAPLVLGLAEQHIKEHGPDGYSDAVFSAVSKLNEWPSAGALRDWIRARAGWRVRYENAMKAYEARKQGLDPNHPELRRLERALKTSEQDLAKLRAQLNAYDAQQTVFEQLAQTLENTVQPLDVVPYEPTAGVGTQHPVDLVVQLTDQHADERIDGPSTWGLERYNFDVYCLRLQRWAQLIVEYATEHLPKHKVERLHIFHTGDSLHGDGHGNKYRNAFGNTMRAAVAVADAQAEAIAYILQRVPYISLVGVSGNHPRTTVKKDHVDPHDNFDFMVVALMAARLSGYVNARRIDLHAPKAWSAFVKVRNTLHALNHGDDVVGTWGIPWYGFSRKQARVQALVGTKDAKIDFFWYGHFHTDIAATENGARGVHSGAFTATDAWTSEKLAQGGEPMQAMMVLDDRPGMRARLLDVPIWLRDPKVEADFWAGKITPKFGRSTGLAQLVGADPLAAGGKLPVIKARR